MRDCDKTKKKQKVDHEEVDEEGGS